jgi:hypothetical protein
MIMIMETDKVSFVFNDNKTGIIYIKNKLTNEKYDISESGFEIITTSSSLRSDDARFVRSEAEENKLILTYSGYSLTVTVTYSLTQDSFFIEKSLSVSAMSDCGIKKVIAGIMNINDNKIKTVEYRYPDFDILERKVEEEYGWGIKRVPDTQPCKTFFGRTEAGGIMAGMELSFDSSSLNENKVIFACSPNLKIKAGSTIDIEPIYIGVYKKSGKDAFPDRWMPDESKFVYKSGIGHGSDEYICEMIKKNGPGLDDTATAHKGKVIPLPCETESMLKLGEYFLGPRRLNALVPVVCGWHSEMEQGEYTDASVEADIKAIGLIKACGINWVTESHPWGGETQKMNELCSAGEYVPGPLQQKFLEQADIQGLYVMQWSTISNTNPWKNGRPFYIDKTEWLRDTGKYIFDWPNEFKGAPGNCSANAPFVDRMKELFKKALSQRGYHAWCVDGDFWGTGGYFQSTIPMECFSKDHDHLAGDANYAAQRSMREWIGYMRKEFPDDLIVMCRPVMDLGIWAFRDIDITFTMIETGTGKSNKKGGDEIRTASRLRTDHHFIPHYLDWPLLFPSYSDPGRRPEWSGDDLDYILISALSCSPNLLFYIPVRTGIPKDDQAEIRKWIGWGRENIELLMVRKDLPAWPGEDNVDGSAHICKNKGLIFLFNPTCKQLSAEIAITEDHLGVTYNGQYELSQEYPPTNDHAKVRYGQKISWQLLPESAVILRIAPEEHPG